jgi:hypothetical protein
MKTIAVFSVVLAASVAFTSCASDETEAPLSSCEEATAHSDFAWIESNILKPGCDFAGCHRFPATSAHGLALDSGRGYSALVNQPSLEQVGKTLVVPGDPATSYLLTALGQGNGISPSDGVMPLGTPRLCAEKVDAIRRWISAGATR